MDAAEPGPRAVSRNPSIESMAHWVRLALLLGLAMGLGATLTGDANAREPQPAYLQGADTPDTSALRARLAQVYAKHGPPAMQVAIVHGATRTAFGFGLIDRAARRSVRPDTVFRYGSVSKLLVASAFVQTLENDGVDLDGPVAGTFPERRLPDGLTYRRLLQHTSALPDILDSASFATSLDATPSRVWSPEELWSVAAALPLRSEPWRYANTNYNLIGEMLQRMRGRPWDEVTANAMGAHSLGVAPREARTGVARGYARACIVVYCVWLDAPAYDPSAYFAAGALGGSAGDLAHVSDRLFQGTVLSPTARREMLRFVDVDLAPYSDIMTGYGLGVMRFRTDGVELWGHTGDVPGFAAIVMHRPDKTLTVAILMNGASGSTAVYRDAIAAVAE